MIETYRPSLVRLTNRVGLGVFSFRRTVSGSTTSMLSIIASWDLAPDFGCVRARSRFHVTTLASRSEPSWNLTPLRSLTMAVVGSEVSQDSARCGFSSKAPDCGLRSSFVRKSKTSGESGLPVWLVWTSMVDQSFWELILRTPPRLIATAGFGAAVGCAGAVVAAAGAVGAAWAAAVAGGWVGTTTCGATVGFGAAVAAGAAGWAASGFAGLGGWVPHAATSATAAPPSASKKWRRPIGRVASWACTTARREAARAEALGGRVDCVMGDGSSSCQTASASGADVRDDVAGHKLDGVQVLRPLVGLGNREDVVGYPDACQQAEPRGQAVRRLDHRAGQQRLGRQVALGRQLLDHALLGSLVGGDAAERHFADVEVLDFLADRLASRREAVVLLPDRGRVGAAAGHVPAVAVAGGQLEHLRAAGGHPDGHVRHDGPEARILELEVAPLKGDGLAGQQLGQDRKVLFEGADPALEVVAEGGVLVNLIAGPDPEQDAPVGQLLEGAGHLGQHAGVAEGRREDVGAELDLLGLHGDGGEQGPDFGERLDASRTVEVVVIRQPDGVIAELFDLHAVRQHDFVAGERGGGRVALAARDQMDAKLK